MTGAMLRPMVEFHREDLSGSVFDQVDLSGARFRNVPGTLGNDWPLRSPGNARTEQFFLAR